MNEVDLRFNYISRILQKTSRKAYEGYVISRLWNKIDDSSIKMVPQQYVNRNIDSYALTDVYFPQFRIHIEINEPAHYADLRIVKKDKKRKVEIEKQTGHILKEIDCRKTFEEINNDIDLIVKYITKRKKQDIKNKLFIPWNIETENTGKFWKKINTLNVDNDVNLSTIEDICHIFDIDFNKTKRGYLRTGGIELPINKDVLVWWPSENSRKGWKNILKTNSNEIEEYNENTEKSAEHYKKHINNKQLRIVFFKYKDILGINKYKFIGVFKLNKTKSLKLNRIIWGKKSNQIQISPFKIIELK